MCWHLLYTFIHCVSPIFHQFKPLSPAFLQIFNFSLNIYIFAKKYCSKYYYSRVLLLTNWYLFWNHVQWIVSSHMIVWFNTKIFKYLVIYLRNWKFAPIFERLNIKIYYSSDFKDICWAYHAFSKKEKLEFMIEF